MPPESNWTAHHEDPSPQRHQPSSWALQSAKGQEKLLGEHTPAPPRLCSGKQRKPFSHPAGRSPLGKAGLGCLWLPGPCCFVGVLRSLKATPNVFSFVGKQDWACEGLLRPGPSHAPRAKLGCSVPRPRLPNGTYPAPGGCSLQRDRKSSSGSKHQPHRAFAQVSNASRFRTQPPARSPAKPGWAASGSLSPAALQGVFGA